MIDYKKKYNEALERARKIHNEILNNELLGFPDQIREIFPELKDGEDERHRKWILEYLYDGLRKADEQFKDHFKSAIDWLEKQKEIQFGVPGLYYYDGEKVHYYGSPATEEKIEKQDVDFSTNDTSKNDARKRRQIIALLSASKGKCMASFAKDIDECVAYLIEKQKEQKLAEPGVTNNESDYDRGYREGHKFGLERTEWYRLLGGKTFMGLIPCWVDAPSTLQPAHKHHGKNLIVMHENNGGFRCCCVDDEKPITFHLPEDTHLVEGWNKKPSEWSEEDDMLMDELESYILYDKEFNDEQKSWRIKRLKSLRPPSKQEWRRFLWHPMMKFDYTSIVKYDGSDEYEIVKAGNKPTREMKGAFIPIKEISTHPHWKPSQEQMKALEHFVDFHSQQYKNTGTRWSDYEALLSLQTDLLKLKLS